MNNTLLSPKDCSFLVKDESTNTELTFELELADEKPIKIGDGTYGVVFACTNPSGEAFALKLFYIPEQGVHLALERFRDEIRAGTLINRNLNRTKTDRTEMKYSNVVEMKGGTIHFKDSPAYKKFQSYFDNLSVSDYALVTVRYKKTLKQVLEEKNSCFTIQQATNGKEIDFASERIPFCRTKGELERFIKRTVLSKDDSVDLNNRIINKQFTGYDILRQMSFETRIRTIIPFLKGIAQGLRTLHEADFLHLDVKTANILVRDTFDEFETVVGDLGFLKPQDYKLFETPPLVPGAAFAFPLGTRHYRSPEQKDYFDIADAELRIVKAGIVLLIEDPKFLDTIIQKGDFVFISKIKRVFQIYKIEVDDDRDETVPVRVCLEVSEKDKARLEPDPRTQVVFYKRQRIRTDLFGFGAVTFDMLTCGKSPERFYELIRAYDREGISVDEIIERYVQVSSFRLGDASLSELFSPFRLNKNSASYAPKEIVELIIKCMLYKASGTFYSSKYEDEPKNIMNDVLAMIKELAEQYQPIEGIEQNLLYSSKLPGGQKIEDGSSISFATQLNDLAKLPKERLIYRMVCGIHQFEKIVTLARSAMRGEKDTFFADLNPQNIDSGKDGADEKLEFKSKPYKNLDSYLTDLRDDLLYTKIGSDLRDEYTPPYFAFIRRKIWLRKNSKLDSSSTKQEGLRLDWDYSFQEASLFGDRLKVGDWIIYKEQGKNRLYRITDVNKASKSLNLEEKQLDNQSDNSSKTLSDGMPRGSQGAHAIYYENIDPEVYYLQMLATYIYQVFFVGIDDNEPESLISNILTSIGGDQISKKVFILDLPDTGKTSNSWLKLSSRKLKVARGKFWEVVDLLIEMYLKLLFSESPDSYYGRYRTNSSLSPIAALLSDIQKLKNVVPQLVNPDYENWQFLADRSLQVLQKEIKDLSLLLGKEGAGDVRFYELACSRLKLETTSQGSFLHHLLR